MSRIWQASAPVTLYHDGKCPLCQREVAWLSRHPRRERVNSVDIRDEKFSPEALGLTFKTMMGRLHVQDARGEWYVGMDASRALYAVLGYRRLVRISLLPGLRPGMDMSYRFFARHRERIGRWLPAPRPDSSDTL
ncbi:thiol-disulfide oxidoreductase DCC family protein [Cobetia sp. L2A1]|jgi:predicted DCC family thiol-disulfide oxidoreductase YuxK|uniref:thiol-disulfide oxidoreductase DCC family protein n=1 Tax=Cobetia sp. L2A1 TaxID=2686360 RepID=UPI00131CE1FC|nr:DUF393 domain-containing protein [Cobetia sp. L2A1]